MLISYNSCEVVKWDLFQREIKPIFSVRINSYSAKDVKYQVRAHFEFNHRRPDLQSDFNEHKHHNIAKRAVQKGGRRDIFLGTRECQAYVEYEEFGSGEGAYDHIDELHYGVMVHGIDYPDESGKEQLMTRLWTPVMKNGVITFIRPDQCTMRRELSTYEAKSFTIGRNIHRANACGVSQ